MKFPAPIQELGNKLAVRMRSKGPYLALHLRMEKDVWVRTGCLPGLSREYDEIIHKERKLRPELLTARSNMTYHDRKLAGLCPLNAVEVTRYAPNSIICNENLNCLFFPLIAYSNVPLPFRLLKALEAPKDTRIYWAGGEPFGGPAVLLPLSEEFPNFYNKENLSLPGELEPFTKKASSLAAIDYIICEKSDVFMPSHGGNMGHMIQGHRAFGGHKKFITPNKRQMLPYFLVDSLPESEFNKIVKELHQGSLGQPEIRKFGRDVTAYPVAECMCNSTATRLVI